LFLTRAGAQALEQQENTLRSTITRVEIDQTTQQESALNIAAVKGESTARMRHAAAR
jgi:hypothetical protein